MCENGDIVEVPLKELREFYPYKVAKYAESRGLLDEPAFVWWCPHVLKKARRIVFKVRIQRVNQKYGITLPKSIEHAIELDKMNGNHFWEDALRKEMTNVGIAF